MSTRCQVQVTQTGLSWKETVTIYHHCDGYPSNMVPLLQKGAGVSLECPELDRWRAGRAGKLACFLILADPDGYDIESSNRLHSDIEYLYLLTAKNTAGGSLAEQPQLLLDVRVPDTGFWDKPLLKNTRSIWSGSLAEANGANIEEIANKE